MLDKQLQSKNIKLLGISYYPRQVLWSTQTLVTLDNLKGRKIRVTTAEQAEFARRMGAIPVTIDTPEVSSALQRGIVSAVLTASSGGGRIWHDLLKYNLRTGPNYVCVIFIANNTNFEKLSPDLRERVSALGRKAAAGLTTLLHQNEDVLTASFAKEGMTVTPGTDGDTTRISETMHSYWAEWAKSRGPEAQDLLTKLLAVLGR